MTRSLIVLPDDSAQPILAAIEGASRTLRVKMFVFSDPELLKAVIAAKRRGVGRRGCDCGRCGRNRSLRDAVDTDIAGDIIQGSWSRIPTEGVPR